MVQDSYYDYSVTDCTLLLGPQVGVVSPTHSVPEHEQGAVFPLVMRVVHSRAFVLLAEMENIKMACATGCSQRDHH